MITHIDSETRSKIIKANYGRDFGWYVECEGRRFGILKDPQYVDMHWTSYHFEPLVDSAAELEFINSEKFWSQDLAFRSCFLESFSPPAIAAPKPPDAKGRVLLRGDYFLLTKDSLTPSLTKKIWDWLRGNNRNK